jgi:NADPH-dependent 2,4-dienoyl-CoA reductase/sulfur reductase-like enzyme/rhodanese-related sulfurtransferase
VSLDVERHVVKVAGPDGEQDLTWDDLVLATGASPRLLEGQPDHPRVVTFHLWDDLEPLRAGLMGGEIDRVALVGAGLVGCELAEAFRSLWGADVIVSEACGAPLPQLVDPDVGACVARHLRDNGVHLLLDSPVERLETDDERVRLVAGGQTVEAQVAVVAVGVEPAVDLARRAGVALGPTGAIGVDDRLATSIPHVWAAGDCVEVRHAVIGAPAYLPLGSLANRQGRTLANILAGQPDRFPPVVGAAAVKVFDRNVAATGCTAALAREHGLRPRSVWISAEDRAHYWPEADEIHLKLVYESSSLRVLGVQAVGAGEVAKRVDVATQLIARGGGLQDFAQLEHAYAPPYAPAMEPLAVAAQVALNQEDRVAAAPPDETRQGAVSLDVRLPDEAEKRPAAVGRGANIPLGDLAGRLDEVDDATELVVCERGTRSAEAVRLLHRRGIRARYLGGGLHWRTAMGRDGES